MTEKQTDSPTEADLAAVPPRQALVLAYMMDHMHLVDDKRQEITARGCPAEELAQLLAEETVRAQMHREHERRLVAVIDAVIEHIEGRGDPHAVIRAFLDQPFSLDNPVSDRIARLGKALELLPVLARSKAHSNSAKEGHKSGPKTSAIAKARADMREMFVDWITNDPGRYRSFAAFVRDMNMKFPDESINQDVVARWGREWKRELGLQSGPIKSRQS